MSEKEQPASRATSDFVASPEAAFAMLFIKNYEKRMSDMHQKISQCV